MNVPFYSHWRWRFSIIDLENQGRQTRKLLLFVDRILEGFEMNKLKKFIKNVRSVLELQTIQYFACSAVWYYL